MRRPIIGTILVLLASVVMTAPAMAAAPANDTHAGRIAIGTIPFHDEVDTRAATTDANDARANEECGSPATDASVWYSVRAPSDRGLVVDVSSSDYTAGAIVVTGRPPSFSLVTCGPETVGFETTEGVVYKILVFDDQDDGGGNGGRLDIVVDEIPPPPEVHVSIDRYGRFHPRTGSATVRGTISCEGRVDDTSVEVMARQRVGRQYIDGYGYLDDIACDGTTRPWSVELSGENGLFKGGKALAVSWAYACGPFECGEGYVEQTVHLRGR